MIYLSRIPPYLRSFLPALASYRGVYPAVCPRLDEGWPAA